MVEDLRVIRSSISPSAKMDKFLVCQHADISVRTEGVYWYGVHGL